MSCEFGGWQLHGEILIALGELHFGENFCFNSGGGAA